VSLPRPAASAPPSTAADDFDRLEVQDVSRHFARRRALSHVTFHAGAGRIVGLLGPNGAGKVHHAGGAGHAAAPHLRRSALWGASRRPSWRGPAVPDRRARSRLFLYPELTARENLQFFAELHGCADPAAVASAALDTAGLADRGDDPVASFSRGMRQRVALERALIHRPRLALLDEPFTGLDDASGAALLDRLRALRSSGAIVVLATHDLDLAEGLFDEVVLLRNGRTVDVLSQPEGLRAAYRAAMTRA
jgi:ABC-type multidrug transport system ATPase subunit